MSELSALYINLSESFTRLERAFLHTQLELEANNPLTFEADSDQIAAFRVLVHAEIEDYLERKAHEFVQLLRSKVSPSFSIKENAEVFLLANAFGIPLPINIPFDPSSMKKSIGKVLIGLEEFISGNNGIKEASFVKLSLICGKMPDEIDITLINMLNSYGSARGDVAHKSTQRVRTLLAPSAERTNALELIQALGEFFYGAQQSAPSTQTTL